MDCYVSGGDADARFLNGIWGSESMHRLTRPQSSRPSRGNLLVSQSKNQFHQPVTAVRYAKVFVPGSIP